MALTQVDQGLLGTYAQYTGFKNRIINGAMVIDQRNAGASVTPANDQYVLDRYKITAYPNASKFTVQQNAGGVTPPAGFSKYLGITVTSAYTVGSTDVYVLEQLIEGQNVADLAFGTGNASPITLSFKVYSSVTGTFGGSITNVTSTNVAYGFTYSIPVANTWTNISITIPGATTGTWLTTNGTGLSVRFGLGAGSDYAMSTSGSWVSGNWYSVAGTASILGTVGNTFYITGVQLEKGSTATSFDYRPYGTELALCQRYAYKLGYINLAVMRESDRYRVGFYVLPVEMRTAVTVPAMTTTDAMSVTISNQTTRGFTMFFLAASSGQTGDINSYLVVTAEL